MPHCAASGAVTAATAIVVGRTGLAGVRLIANIFILGARHDIALFFIGATGFLIGFIVKLSGMAGIIVATSLHAVRRCRGEQAEEEQYANAEFHIRNKGRKDGRVSIGNIF